MLTGFHGLLGGTHVVASQDAVEELQCAHNGDEDEEDVDELGPLRRLVHVIAVDVLQHLVPVGRGALGCWRGNGRRDWRCSHRRWDRARRRGAGLGGRRG